MDSFDIAPSTYPLLLAAVAWGLRTLAVHWVERRRFYRRNSFGLEAFPSYRRWVMTRWFETTVTVVGQLAGAVGIGLVCMFAIMHCGETAGGRGELDHADEARTRTSELQAQADSERRPV